MRILTTSPVAMDHMTELRTRVQRDEYEVDPRLVAEALLRRIDLLGAPPEARDERLSRPDARGPSGPRPDGPSRPAA